MRVGAIELRLLEHCTATGPITVREAAETFGKEQGIGLTTVQQMMERLRNKGLMTRERAGGVWVYRGVETRENLMKAVVKDFVERTLGGSLEPFALYLADASTLSGRQLEEVKRLAAQLSSDVEKSDGK